LKKTDSPATKRSDSNWNRSRGGWRVAESSVSSTVVEGRSDDKPFDCHVDAKTSVFLMRKKNENQRDARRNRPREAPNHAGSPSGGTSRAYPLQPSVSVALRGPPTSSVLKNEGRISELAGRTLPVPAKPFWSLKARRSIQIAKIDDNISVAATNPHAAP
jgi:hypothetical protein